jgi:hypothetical protein
MHTLPNLPASAAREVFAALCATMPRPVPDTPEARAARDDVAMGAVAALHPTDLLEAKLAVAIVAAEAYAEDCLRLADDFRADIAASLRCRAQATAMLRQMRHLLRDYQRMQEARDKAIAAMHPAAMERAGYWWREVTLPEPAAPPAPGPDADPGPPPAAGPAAPPDAGLAAAGPAVPPFETLTEAEQYALIHPRRAALIRASGGLPARPDFGPPEPDTVAELVHGTSPVLRMLDRPPLAVAAE